MTNPADTDTALTSTELRALKSAIKRADAGKPIKRASETHWQLRRLGFLTVGMSREIRDVKRGCGAGGWKWVEVDVVKPTDAGRIEAASY